MPIGISLRFKSVQVFPLIFGFRFPGRVGPMLQLFVVGFNRHK